MCLEPTNQPSGARKPPSNRTLSYSYESQDEAEYDQWENLGWCEKRREDMDLVSRTGYMRTIERRRCHTPNPTERTVCEAGAQECGYGNNINDDDRRDVHEGRRPDAKPRASPMSLVPIG